MEKTICEDMLDFYKFNVEGVYTEPLYPDDFLYPNDTLFPKDNEEA